ncbi:DUF418 domain-containing protein [Sphingomicrobium astaxanthinifaciens]|uniref:DUF418 domain-containing protein n=1 Tax=Sphingomicrobium astaxanthinifaciens TaxID=1227949 RepID=UPI001FCAE0BA|nr:DUF418 domain-containing protein [Sphingomicrobium astaxanthinifaciens]MCJ7421354.1 DUF418 domain-containing protein [Sphingomicrobium astaxanthinifaciens]
MNRATMPAGPIDAAKRLVLLDGVRGLALLGILFANMTSFSGWYFMEPSQNAAVAVGAIDRWIDLAFEMLVHGKFYALFSLLFGIGFALQLERIEARGEGAGRYARRLVFLALFGVAHILLVWIGDILLLYALMGFVLLALRGLPTRALIPAAAICWLLPVGWAAYQQASGFNAFAALMPPIAPLAAALDVPFGPGGPTAIWESPYWGMQMRSHVIDLYLRFVVYLDEMRFTKVLGMFLVGLWVGRAGLHRDPGAHRALLRKVAVVGLAVGLPVSLLKAAMVLEMWTPASGGLTLFAATYSLSVPLLALAYAALAALAYAAGREGWLGLFAPMGRMALTNYLVQSVLQAFIFFGFGLGLVNRFALLWHVPLTLAIFAAQVVFSRWWLARHRFGPAEWLWRSLTYGKAQPMRLATGQQAIA